MISIKLLLHTKQIDPNLGIQTNKGTITIHKLLKDYARLILIECKEIVEGPYNEHPDEFYEKIAAIEKVL